MHCTENDSISCYSNSYWNNLYTTMTISNTRLKACTISLHYTIVLALEYLCRLRIKKKLICRCHKKWYTATFLNLLFPSFVVEFHKSQRNIFLWLTLNSLPSSRWKIWFLLTSVIAFRNFLTRWVIFVLNVWWNYRLSLSILCQSWIMEEFVMWSSVHSTWHVKNNGHYIMHFFDLFF